MNRDDIIRMAREAGISKPWDQEPVKWETLERFAALVAADEREACETLFNERVLESIRFNADVRKFDAAIKAEREACAKFIEQEYVRQFDEPWRDNLAKAIRARGDALAKLNQAAEANGEEL